MTLVQPQSAAAAPPTADDFTIQYWTTKADGTRGRQMTANDLRGYVNKARCECGQAVSARIRLQSGTALDSVPVRAYIGNNCGTAEAGNNQQNFPCALAINDFTNTYTRNIDFEFNPLWLATGVTPGSPRDINTAEARYGCDAQTGDGGIWVCVEDGDQTDCQVGEFVIQGTQTEISDADGNTPALTFDFLAPTINATDFRASGGDGSVVIKWDNSTTTDIQGYRALCANADGTPVASKGFSISSVTAENRGTVYYTAENLCPDGPFDQVDVDPDPDPILPGSSDTDGGDTDGDTDGGGETGGGTSGASEFGAEPGVAHGGTGDCCGVGSCSDNTCLAAVAAELGDCADTWSEACAALANDYCEVCGGAGNCCAENTSPSCADSECTLAVCQVEGFEYCCADRWDAACANEAKGDTGCMVCEAGTTGEPGMTSGATTTTATASSTTTSSTETDTDTDSGTDTDGLDTSGIETLHWDYVCSDFIAANASTARIDGLTNDRDYQVLLVAFDYAGNPVSASEVFIATPRETTDLWEQCNAQGEICGKGGFCSCTTDGPSRHDAGWLLLTGLLGLVARRRRSAGGQA
ncbi:MAG: MYXO-CTERM sorting domain-containing protein [Nannocystales bacterium]